MAGGHEDYPVTGLGHRLVEAALVVTEIPGEPVVGHETEADLVRHEDNGAGQPVHGFAQPGCLGRDITFAKGTIGKPEGQAIDEDRPAGIRFPFKQSGEVELFFKRGPVRAAPIAVEPDSLAHLVIAGFRRRDIDRLETTVGDEFFGKQALA